MRTPSRATFALVLVASLGARAVAAEPLRDYEEGRAAFHRGDVIAAMDRLRRAADAGLAPAQTLLAYIFDRAELDAEALVLYRAAAEQGDAEGMFGLGSMYASGEGVEPNHAEAVRWYEAAGAKGHARALAVLAEAYLKGGLGLTPDRDKALELLDRSAATGYEPARDRLAELTAQKS